MFKALIRSLALILALQPTLALAQSPPATLPDHTVYGRIGTGGASGPGQAIPFANLKTQLGVPALPEIYATSYGVKCDGVTNDSAALQLAINTADSLGGGTVILPAGTCNANANVFLNKWTTNLSILTVPGLKMKGQGKGVTIIDTRVANDFAISANPAWKAAHQALFGITASTSGGSLATNTYYVQITVNDGLGNEIFVTLPKSIAVTGATGSISIVLPALANPGYSFNIYCDTASTPAHLCGVGAGTDATGRLAGTTVVATVVGSAHAVPTTKRAVWQEASISDLEITNSTSAANASGVSFFKAGYSDLTNVYMKGLTGDGFTVQAYSGDVDGSFNVAVHNSKFDTIAGTCVNAAGNVLELTNFTVDDRTAFNICGTAPAAIGVSKTISAISNSSSSLVTTSTAHNWALRDQIYISGVTGMTLADGWFRVCGSLGSSTFNLCDLNGNQIDTTALGSYTASSGAGKLAWRPPFISGGVLTGGGGCLAWTGLIGTFRNLDFTQCNNFGIYFSEVGSSDNATVENVDLENTAGKGLYNASLQGGSFTNSECLSATSAGATISCVQIGTGFAAGGVQNFKIENIKVRSDVANVTAFEQFQNTNNTSSASDTNRVRNITWQTFDATSAERRFDGFKFDPIPGQAQFSISAANTAKLIPVGYGGTLPLCLKANGECLAYHVPSAGITGAVTGGLSATTSYNCYAYNSAASTLPYVISFECNATATALYQGFSVKSGDVTRTFIGTATTDGSGNFQAAGVQTSQYPIKAAAPITVNSSGAVGCPTCVLISGTAHGNSDYTILSTDRYVYTSAAFTAPRTWTLPAANSLAAGTTIWIGDSQNTVTTTNTLTVQRAGADLINNFSASLQITGAAGGVNFTTDGVSNWGAQIQTVSTGGTGQKTLTNHGVLVGAGANPVTQLAVGSNGQLLLGATGADPAFGTMSQDCTITAAGVITCTKTNNVSFGALATVAAGTGVATAAAINTNVNGSVITNGSGAVLQGSPADPAGVNNATQQMSGLGTTCTLTPTQSTRVHLEFQGDAFNASAGGSVQIQARYGTGAAPANAAVVIGTTIGSKPQSLLSSANNFVFFRAGGNITGLTRGTAYWFDLAVGNNGNGTTATLSNVSCDAFEIP